MSLQRIDWDAIGITADHKFEGSDNRIRSGQKEVEIGESKSAARGCLESLGRQDMVGPEGALHQSGGTWSSDGVLGTGLLEGGRRHCLNQPPGSFRQAWPLWSYFCQV